MNILKFNQIEFNHIGQQPSMPLQEKSVTITENGITEIVPDSGYALKKVKVAVGDIHKIKYYRVTPELIEAYASWNLDQQDSFCMVLDTILVSMNGINFILPLRTSTDSIEGVTAFSVNFSKKITYDNPLILGNIHGYTYFFKIDNTTIYDILNTLPEITAEEYYNFK